MFIQIHHLEGIVGHGHAARSPLFRGPALSVGVEQDGVVVGVDQGEGARAAAVVDGGGVWTHDVPFEGDGEAAQPADVVPRRGVSALPAGPQSILQIIRVGHRLQGLQQKKGAVLAFSCHMQKRKQKHKLKKSGIT